jgi:hypothetical protein
VAFKGGSSETEQMLGNCACDTFEVQNYRPICKGRFVEGLIISFILGLKAKREIAVVFYE